MDGHAALKVSFSATEHSSVRDVEVSTEVPPPSAETWEELAAFFTGVSDQDDRDGRVGKGEVE
jgi:hypothetical protein